MKWKELMAIVDEIAKTHHIPPSELDEIEIVFHIDKDTDPSSRGYQITYRSSETMWYPVSGELFIWTERR